MYGVVHADNQFDGCKVDQRLLIVMRVRMPLVHLSSTLVLLDEMRHELGMRSEQVCHRYHVLEAVLLSDGLDVCHADHQYAGVAVLR